jgi:hypothetical protein
MRCRALAAAAERLHKNQVESDKTTEKIISAPHALLTIHGARPKLDISLTRCLTVNL